MNEIAGFGCLVGLLLIPLFLAGLVLAIIEAGPVVALVVLVGVGLWLGGK